jgi:hypothetical protein
MVPAKMATQRSMIVSAGDRILSVRLRIFQCENWGFGMFDLVLDLKKDTSLSSLSSFPQTNDVDDARRTSASAAAARRGSIVHHTIIIVFVFIISSWQKLQIFSSQWWLVSKNTSRWCYYYFQ